MAQLEVNRYGDLERRHLRVAVLFSLLLHAGLLPWDFVGEFRQETLSRPLSVRIIHPPPSQRVAGPELGHPPRPDRLTQEHPAQDDPGEAVPEVKPAPPAPPDPVADPATENQQEEMVQPAEPASAEGLSATEAPAVTFEPPAEAAEQPASASEVAVLLLIDANGEVLQIVWNKLPAISYATLDRMEMQLREKKYPPAERPHTLTVVVTVPK